MVRFEATVAGRFTEPAGGGPVFVPRGRCRVEVYQGVVSLSWDDNGEACSVTMPAHRLDQRMEDGVIVLEREYR